jgi:hypothetical protein
MRLPYLQGKVDYPWSKLLVYEVGQQGALKGPLCVEAAADQVQKLPAMAYSHLAYVCYK